MFGWFKRNDPPARLPGLLADYPPWAPPHLGRATKFGSGPLLTIGQCRENLSAYKTAMPDRLRLLRELVVALDLDTALAYSDPLAFVRRLHPTMLTELPSVYLPELKSHAAGETSDRAGPAIALSLMADLAMLNADVMMRAKPSCFVGLNLDRGDRDMFSYRRPCLLGLTDRLFPHLQLTFHLEDEWFGYYANMDHPPRLAPPDFADGMYMDVIGGGMLERLDRCIVDPKLDERLRTTWLGKAA